LSLSSRRRISWYLNMREKTDQEVINYLKHHVSGVERVSRLAGDASTRNYFRLFTGAQSIVAMVYPENNSDEINRIRALTQNYREAGLNVPEIVDQIGDNILLQEDLGDISLQNYLSDASGEETLEIRNDIQIVLEKLKNIPSGKTFFNMDLDKMRFEIDFFINNFVNRFIPSWKSGKELREEILQKLEKISTETIFAHRDFHSRNIFIKDSSLYLIDFQDSLLAPKYYDAVSFVFDSYLKPEAREIFLSIFKNKTKPELEQIYLTAYQRNIKALGTFGFQYFSGNRKFFHSIKPTISNLRKNIHFAETSLLAKFFSLLEKEYQI